uniref:uncharacterized protein LOC101306111 isoform X2 n=1 Tax=Fragaria vesca subsp. vesca TaxID=101020 RepID=UPI0005C8DB6D|nr:PREDICTED: uncharacterized protein LOC101306111 isoform X2 [Fragaria vesca subsp. vesca]
MECNKDDGVRAKEIAERKFSERDIMGAKKFALKAQALYPGLDGIRQLLATLDVYMCATAENKIGGEPDWYGILGVDPEADDETVKKRYRTLALNLHPDKNKSAGAGGAFNLVKDACDLLSDKNKRAAYDRRRDVHVRQNVVHQNISTTNQASKEANGSVHQKVSTAQSSQGANGSAHQKFSTGAQDSHGANGTTTKGRESNAKAQTRTKRPAPSSAPASVKPIPKSFWCECPKCWMRFEYLGKYLRWNGFCPNCNKLFQAVEIVPPAMCGSKSTTPVHTGRSTSASENVGATGFISHVSFTQKSVIWAPFSRAASASQAAKAAKVDFHASGRAAGPSKSAKASGGDKLASKRGRKCPFDEDTLARAKESFTWDLNDDERKKRFDARRKDFDANGRRDDGIL